MSRERHYCIQVWTLLYIPVSFHFWCLLHLWSFHVMTVMQRQWKQYHVHITKHAVQNWTLLHWSVAGQVFSLPCLHCMLSTCMKFHSMVGLSAATKMLMIVSCEYYKIEHPYFHLANLVIVPLLSFHPILPPVFFSYKKDPETPRQMLGTRLHVCWRVVAWQGWWQGWGIYFSMETWRVI